MSTKIAYVVMMVTLAGANTAFASDARQISTWVKPTVTHVAAFVAGGYAGQKIGLSKGLKEGYATGYDRGMKAGSKEVYENAFTRALRLPLAFSKDAGEQPIKTISSSEGQDRKVQYATERYVGHDTVGALFEASLAEHKQKDAVLFLTKRMCFKGGLKRVHQLIQT